MRVSSITVRSPTPGMKHLLCMAAIGWIAVGSSVFAGQTVPLSEDELTRLLDRRLDGGLGYTFAQFANMFVPNSTIQLPQGVILVAKTKAIDDTELMPVFPEHYRPRLRELLDAIALQTSSTWAYVTESDSLKSDSKTPVGGIVCIEFSPTESRLELSVEIPPGWSVRDVGNRRMCAPPTFPVGIDFYHMGTYSFDGDRAAGMEKIVKSIALDWASRVKEGTSENDLGQKRIGAYDALTFETTIPSRLGMDLIWRHWVFAAEDRCYFVVSTLDQKHLKQQAADIDAMLDSFKPSRTAPPESEN